MQLWLSSSITETPGISQKELSSLGGRLPQYLLLFLFSAPPAAPPPPPPLFPYSPSLSLSPPPSFLSSNHSVTSGCRCQSQACRVCVCMLIAGGPGLPRRHTQHVSRSVTSAGQQRTAPVLSGPSRRLLKNNRIDKLHG